MLGLSISLDELAIGFGLGLLHLPTLAALGLIGRAQAFLVAQLGLRLERRVGETVREGAETLAGVGLIAIGILLPGREAPVADAEDAESGSSLGA